MSSLNKMIVKYFEKLTIKFVVIVLIITILYQVLNTQNQALEASKTCFQQIEHILNENNLELEQIEKEYTETCLNNAEGIAYVLQYHPEAMDDINELNKIAEFVEVDEIHIFNKEGEIIKGTHPEYYGFSFESGEQIGFFKPMLNDKSLKLCQDITPNTAEEKMMQYSAVWSENGEFILQIGVSPQNVMKVMEKNELSYIFLMLRVNPGISFLAIDKETGAIIGSTDETSLNKNITEIGLTLDKIETKTEGFHAKVKDTYAYCIFEEIDGNYIGRIVPISTLYQRIPTTSMSLTICLILISILLVHAVTKYINKLENERDIDILTGIYNRRGMELRLEELFKDTNNLKNAALIMIDADELKSINDNYGHSRGDIYLKTLANMLKEFSCERCICSRQGGDEFLLFLYGYETEEELQNQINTIANKQDSIIINLFDDINVPLKFSIGYAYTKDENDIDSLIKKADKLMYSNKINRKKR